LRPADDCCWPACSPCLPARVAAGLYDRVQSAV
jgi:hypothetical protein